jgi:hypothetical protein
MSIPTTGICAASDIASDFNAGTLGTTIITALDGNGSLILKPAEQQDFEASTPPAGWTSAAWSGSNTPVYNGGIATFNGGHLFSNKSYTPGTAVEFVAKFSDDINQNIGFSASGNFNSPWVVIGRDALSQKGHLFARSDNGGREILGTNLTGQYHRFKIQWNSNNFEFYVDGTLITAIYETMASGIIQVSDFNSNTLDLSLDWIRILPYSASGTYISKVFDAGTNTIWTNPFWNAIQNSGTDLSISVRTGNTSTPDGNWTNFINVTNGGKIDLISRYIQYSATLSSTDNKGTPVLQNILISCNFALPDTSFDLKGNVLDKDIRLDWATDTEYNNKGFEIQRSLNGTDWTTIGFVGGAGNSTVLMKYEFTDKNLATGKYYYRLKQVAFNNRIQYSNVINITLNSISEFSLEQNYPNPFTGQTTIAYAVPKATNVRLIIYDVQGRTIKVIDEGMKTSGRYTVDIQAGQMVRGIYYYRMEADGFSSVRKMFAK